MNLKESDKMNKLFVYGSLKSEKVQKELFAKVLKSYEAELINYALYEAEDGYYFIKKELNEIVKGYILELEDYDLKICDAFEECPEMYHREKINCLCEGNSIEVYVYIRVDNVGNYKKVENFDLYSGLSENKLIENEIKIFKEKEHPEFYSK